MKKTMIVLIGLVLTVSTCFATPSDWAEDSVFSMKYEGFIDGELGDMNKLQQRITREEFAELAVKMYLEAKKLKIENIDVGMSFDDTDNPYVGAAFNLGIVTGIDNKQFAPKSNVTREQIATMFIRQLATMGIDTTVTTKATYGDFEYVSSWAKDGISFASQEGILQGVGGNNVAPKDYATREQAIVLINKIGKKYNWFGNFKTYTEDKYNSVEGFKVPSRTITQLSAFTVGDSEIDLRVVSKGYVMSGALLDMETQHKQIYDILRSQGTISFKAIDTVMETVKSSWNLYGKVYELDRVVYIDATTGVSQNTVPSGSYIKITAKATLIIDVVIK